MSRQFWRLFLPQDFCGYSDAVLELTNTPERIPPAYPLFANAREPKKVKKMFDMFQNGFSEDCKSSAAKARHHRAYSRGVARLPGHCRL